MSKIKRLKLNRFSKVQLEIKIAEQEAKGQTDSKYYKDLKDRQKEILRLEGNYTRMIQDQKLKKKTVVKRIKKTKA